MFLISFNKYFWLNQIYRSINRGKPVRLSKCFLNFIKQLIQRNMISISMIYSKHSPSRKAIFSQFTLFNHFFQNFKAFQKFCEKLVFTQIAQMNFWLVQWIKVNMIETQILSTLFKLILYELRRQWIVLIKFFFEILDHFLIYQLFYDVIVC